MVTSGTTLLLSQLKFEGVVILNDADLSAFLDDNQQLIRPVKEIIELLKKEFQSKVEIDLYMDPEGTEQKIFVSPITSLPVEEAMARIDCFRDKWWAIKDNWQHRHELAISLELEE